MPDVATIHFDHAQYRLKGGRNLVAVAIRGEDWDGDIFDDVTLDPVTNSVILRPMCMYSNYWSVNTGIAAKPTIGSGLEVKTSAKWRAVDALKAGFTTHGQCDDASGEYIRTSSALGANQGVFVSVYINSAGDGARIHMGWSNSTTPAADTASIGVEVYRGRVTVYKAGNYVGAVSISPDKNHLLNLVLLPGRRRELLLFTTDGRDGGRMVFDDIDEDDTSPAITPAEKFFVTAPDGGNLQVLIHDLAFQATGYVVSKTFKMVRPPAAGMTSRVWSNPIFTGITNASVYGDKAYAGTSDVSAISIKQSDGTTAFTPDGTSTECRIRVDLSGDGNYTPFVYGSVFEYQPEFATTDSSEEFDATPYVAKEQEIALTVPDDGLECTVAATLSDPDTVEADVPQVKIQVYRPCDLRIGELQILDCFMRRPRTGDGIEAEVRRMGFEMVSVEALLEKYRFPFRVPMDGWPLCEGDGFSAIRYLLTLVVDPSRLRLSSLGYTIGEIPDADGSDWNLAAEAGETGLEVLEKLHRLAADCVYGVHPGPDGPEFWFYAPADLPQEPAITLYRSREDAQIAYPDLTDDEAMDRCFDNWWEEPLELEANDVSSLGIDPRSGDFVAAWAVDEASQDPTLPPSSRPDNWAGFPLSLGVAARQIRSTPDAEKVVESLFPLATETKRICEWDANTLIMVQHEDSGIYLPLWRMDLVNLDGKGERRISGLNARLMVESTADDLIVRRAHYTGGTILGRGGRTVSEIQGIQRMRLAQRGVRQMTPINGLFMRSSSSKVTKVTP